MRYELTDYEGAGLRQLLPNKPHGVPRVAIEAGVREYWCRFVASREHVVGIDSFGASAPAKDLFKHFGFTTEHVVRVAEAALRG